MSQNSQEKAFQKVDTECNYHQDDPLSWSPPLCPTIVLPLSKGWKPCKCTVRPCGTLDSLHGCVNRFESYSRLTRWCLLVNLGHHPRGTLPTPAPLKWVVFVCQSLHNWSQQVKIDFKIGWIGRSSAWEGEMQELAFSLDMMCEGSQGPIREWEFRSP